MLRDRDGEVARIAWPDPPGISAAILRWIDRRGTPAPALIVEPSGHSGAVLALLSELAVAARADVVLGVPPEPAPRGWSTPADPRPRYFLPVDDGEAFSDFEHHYWNPDWKFGPPPPDPPPPAPRAPPGPRRRPRPRARPARSPGRAVDLALRAATGRGAPTAVVSPNTSLVAGKRYGVCVRIGARLRGSLFRTPPPAIDPLLPPPVAGKVRRLEVTLFTLDFTAISPSVQALLLPAAGPSDPILFELRAPARAGQARFRVVVSFRDHMLQAFVVTAKIGRRTQRSRARAVDAALECATTEHFTNLEALKPRGATAIINDDPTGRHSITIKRGTTLGTFTFTEDQTRKAVSQARQVLEEAAKSGQFDDVPRRGTPAYVEREASYRAVIRKLAVLGASVKSALFKSGDEAGSAMIAELSGPASEVLQLVHVARALVLPWAILYDGWLPRDRKTVDVPVCIGEGADGAPCGHTSADKIICVRGFWGLRHDLELLTGRAVATDAVATWQVPSGRAALGIMQGKSLTGVQYLPACYEQLLARPEVKIWKDDVYALLAAATRPAIFVAIGHFSVAMEEGVPVHAIDLEPEPLTDTGLSDEVERPGGVWEFPHSIVVLLACSSAVPAADALTGMIDAFASARAGAIIGTECTVFPRFSARVASAIYEQLVANRGKLAASLRALRWELAREASPLGFALTAYGNADLGRAG
jgi:hypothetical protein